MSNNIDSSQFTVSAVEEMIILSQISCTTQEQYQRKESATILINQLQTLSDCWNVGLELFFNSSDDSTKFFGLSMIRNYMTYVSSIMTSMQIQSQASLIYQQHLTNIQRIRESIIRYIHDSITSNISIPNYIFNNISTIITIAIKHEFPKIWPLAFNDILTLGKCSVNGLLLAVKVFKDLGVEVVEYNENRNKYEIIQNSLIKDEMRASNIINDITEFLTSSSISTRGHEQGNLSVECLRCLSDLIGWCDINLIVNENRLSIIYQSLRDPVLAGACCSCLFEIVKKGMDPISKIQMLLSIDIIQVLNSVPISNDEETDGCEDELGNVVNILVLELLNFWCKFEEECVYNPSNSSVSSDCIREISPNVALMLRSILPTCMKLFEHPDITASCSVIESLNKLISLINQQLLKSSSIENVLPSLPGYFLAIDYLNPLLSSIYKQMQYPIDFEFEDDEDDALVIEAKKDVRKIFVNCCRVYPENCLQLITAVLSSLPQPLSIVPFPALEAALRLVYSFAECGPQHNKLVNEDSFPQILTAIHQTDVASHPHPQVILAYYEISERYFRYIDELTIQKIVTSMIGVQGLRHEDPQLRCRTAYILCKICEKMEGKSSILLPIVGSFAEIGKEGLLSEIAERHLLEAISKMTSSTYLCGETELQLQYSLLFDILNVYKGQINSILYDSNFNNYRNDYCQVVSKIILNIASLAKGYNSKHNVNLLALFNDATTIITEVCSKLSDIVEIRKSVILYAHRMISIMGNQCQDFINGIISILLNHADKDTQDVVQVLNQFMAEFGNESYALINNSNAVVHTKFSSIITYSNKDGVLIEEAPHVEVERAAIQCQYLTYLLHVVCKDCHLSLISAINFGNYEEIMNYILSGIKGGIGKISVSCSIPLRKIAASIVVGLVKNWSNPTNEVSQQLMASFNSYLYDLFLPSIMQSLTVIDLNDGKTQEYTSEIGELLWNINLNRSRDLNSYFQSLLTALNWNSNLIMNFNQIIHDATSHQCHNFRDLFKKFIRKNVS